jgi:hypothetical protein
MNTHTGPECPLASQPQQIETTGKPLDLIRTRIEEEEAAKT